MAMAITGDTSRTYGSPPLTLHQGSSQKGSIPRGLVCLQQHLSHTHRAAVLHPQVMPG